MQLYLQTAAGDCCAMGVAKEDALSIAAATEAAEGSVVELDPIDRLLQHLFPESLPNSENLEVVESDPIEIDKVLQILFPEDGAAPQPLEGEVVKPPQQTVVREAAAPARPVVKKAVAPTPPVARGAMDASESPKMVIAPASQLPIRGAAYASSNPKEALLVSILKRIPGLKGASREFLVKTIIPYIKYKRQAKMTNSNQDHTAAQVDNLIERLKELNVATREVLQAARAGNDLGMVLKIIYRLEQQIELEGKLLGKITNKVHLMDLLGDDAGGVENYGAPGALTPQFVPPGAAAAQGAGYSPAQPAAAQPQQGLQMMSKAAIMFADIVDSASLNGAIGADKAREVTAACIKLMSDIIGEQHGVLVKSIGVEVMCTFESADAGAGGGSCR